MYRYLLIFILSFNFSFSNENAVKTSELELFLFKVGFESLLKDVDMTKDKSTLNENEIKTINEKIELIMSELYKDKRVLLNDSENISTQSTIDSKELNSLKNEIEVLRNEIEILKEHKIKVLRPNPIKVKSKNIKLKKIEVKEIQIKKEEKQKEFVNKIKSNSKDMRVATKLLAVYIKPNTQSEVIRKIKHNTIIQIEKCNGGWCKLKDEKYFVRKFLIKEH